MKSGYLVLSIVLVLTACSLSQAATKVLEWKFENNLNDTSGSGINGVEWPITGSVLYTPGVDGQCFDGNGVNSAFRTTGIDANVLPVKAVDTWSVNVWVRPNGTPGDWMLAWALGQKPVANPACNSRTVYSSSAANVVFTDGKGTSFLSPGVPWTANQWQMITTTYDGTKVRLYKNGILIGSKAWTFYDAVAEVRMASYAWGNTVSFNGDFDEFTVWRGALTHQEIVDMLIPGVVPEPNLLEEKLYFKMDDPCESTMKMPDHSGSNNDGELYGYTPPLTDWITDGQRSGAFLFNGGQTVWKMPTNVSQNLQYTAAMWIKSGTQNYSSSFYCEKSSDDDIVTNKGSSFIIQAEDKVLHIYSTDQYYSKVYDIRYDASGYLDGTTWNHIAVVADGDIGITKLYINGDFADSNTHQRADSKVDMTSSIGYNINGNGFISGAQIDEVRLYKGLLSETNIKALASKGNVDNDTDVDFSDVAILAGDWLVENVAISPDVFLVDDMEGSIAGWAPYPNSDPKYTGYSDVNLTTNAHTGSGALQWNYYLPATSEMSNYANIAFDFGQEIDFSSYDYISLYLFRHEGNADENLLYLKFYNAAKTVKAEMWDQTNNVDEPNNAWGLWQTSLDSLLGEGGTGSKTSDDLTDVRYILIGCGSWDKNTARSGVIDIDDVTIVRNVGCAEKLEGDINLDCTINFSDFAILAEDWMLGVE